MEKTREGPHAPWDDGAGNGEGEEFLLLLVLATAAFINLIG